MISSEFVPEDLAEIEQAHATIQAEHDKQKHNPFSFGPLDFYESMYLSQEEIDEDLNGGWW